MPFDSATFSVHWVGRIEKVAKELKGLLAPIEQRFARMGQCLDQARRVSAGLADNVGQLSVRLGGEEFQHMLAGLDDAAGMVVRLQRQLTERSGALAEVTKTADGIRAALTALNQTVFRINVVGVNARVETAHLEATGIDFAVFTHGVVTLAANGARFLKEAEGDLNNFTKALDGASDAAVSFERVHLGNLLTIGKRLEGSIQGLRGRERHLGEVLRRLPYALDEIQHSIGMVISDLQIGDIAVQRIDHVVKALAVIEQAISGHLNNRSGSLSQRDLHILVHAVAELQSRQLEEIADDLGERCTTLSDRIKGLFSAVESIEEAAEAAISAQSAGTSFIAEVEGDLRAVVEIIVNYRRAIEAVSAHMAEVSDTIEAMRQSIRRVGEIDAEINVIGLNASIKCGNIGAKARTLNVIAQELRGCARETRSFTERINERLTATEQSSSGLQLAAEDLAEVSALEEGTGRSASLLQTVGRETDDVLDKIRSAGAAAIGSNRDALAEFGPASIGIPLIRQSAEEMRALANDADPRMPEDELRELRRQVLDFMSDHYTMASERDLHAALIGSPLAVTHEAATSGDIDDLLF